MRDYYYIFKELKPRRDALHDAEARLAKINQELTSQKKENRNIE
jgi:hypothetical protein